MKATSENKKKILLTAFAALAIFFFQGNLMAAGLILKHTGTIRITRPDGQVFVIEPNQALPDIPSGSKVEVLNGSIEIESFEGFIQVVLGDLVATVKAGDNVTAAIDKETGSADFKVKAGPVNIISGNTKIILGARQQARIILDKVTGTTTVQSITGAIETVTFGVKAVIAEGAIARIRADVKTRNVHIECVTGAIYAVTTGGKVIEIKKGEPRDILGSAEGETGPGEEPESPFEPVEEPVPPQRPEGSPYN